MRFSEMDVADDPKHGKHEYMKVNGVKFHYVTKGRGPLMLMLHGFPEVSLVLLLLFSFPQSSYFRLRPSLTST